LVSLSIMLTFILQAIIYVISNLGYGIFPVLSLPLISYGKTALIINSSLINRIYAFGFQNRDVFKDSIKAPEGLIRYFRMRMGSW